MSTGIISKIIIVLGYTLNQDCSLSPILQSRLDAAIRLYSPCDIVVISGKMPPKSLVAKVCIQMTEAEAMKRYLIEKGISENKIIKEDKSTTTFGNAFYSHLTNLKENVKNEQIVIVSNEFHMPLVKYYFKKVLGDKFQYIFYEIPESTLDISKKELEAWKRIVYSLVENYYPLKYGKIVNGDFDALQKRIANRKTNSDFDDSIRALLKLEPEVELDDSV